MFSSLPSRSTRSTQWSATQTGLPVPPSLLPLSFVPSQSANRARGLSDSSPSHLKGRGTASRPLTTELGPSEADIFQTVSDDALLQAVLSPPEEESHPPGVVYVDSTRNVLSQAVLSCLHVRPNTVVLNVYDLREGLVQANDIAMYQVGMGGAFHVGTEVYGGEWAYGTSGVTCEAPRSATSHAYKCSVIVGCTVLDQSQVAALLRTMVLEWNSTDYSALDHNCCSFAAEFCDYLGVGPMPPWIDRFSRLLSEGQKAGQNVGNSATAITTEAAQWAQQLPAKVQPHLDFAAQVGSEVWVASKSAMHQGNQQAQGMITRLWQGMQTIPDEEDEASPVGSALRVESQTREAQQSSIGHLSFDPVSMSLSPSWVFPPLAEPPPQPPIQPLVESPWLSVAASRSSAATSWNGISGCMTPSQIGTSSALDSQMTLPAYPSFDHTNGGPSRHTVGPARSSAPSTSSFGSVIDWGSKSGVATTPSLVGCASSQPSETRSQIAQALGGFTYAAPASSFGSNIDLRSKPSVATTSSLAGYGTSQPPEFRNQTAQALSAVTYAAAIPAVSSTMASTSSVATTPSLVGYASFQPPEMRRPTAQAVAYAAPASSNPLPLTPKLTARLENASSASAVPRTSPQPARVPHVTARPPVRNGAGATSLQAGFALPQSAGGRTAGPCRSDSFASTVVVDDPYLPSKSSLPPSRPDRPAYSTSIMDRPC